jgi:hypothetical protein
MQCVAIPRFDVGSPGILLVWTPPDMLGVSVDGYDVQRRIWSSRKQLESCVSLTSDQLAQLRSVFELDTALGPVLYGPAPAFPVKASDVLTGSTNGATRSINAVLERQLRPFTGFSALALIDRITIELN